MSATKGSLLRESRQPRLPQKNTSSLLRAVQERLQERASANEKKEEVRGLLEIKLENQVARLPKTLISKILLLLPDESLCRSSFVCKAWFDLINSLDFIEAHLSQSKTVLIFLKPTSQRRPKTFSIEAKLSVSEDSEPFSIFARTEPPRYCQYINFLEVQDGMGKVIESNISGIRDVLATCNGLILATCEQKSGLLVMNPATRKLIALPLGTIGKGCTIGKGWESYGFIFSHLTREYKVVHLFRDAFGYIGCEILSVNRRSWWVVGGPSEELFSAVVHKPVTAIGALHWVPSRYGSTSLVSFGIDDEKFHKINLPTSSCANDRLVEIGGFLGFVTHVEQDRIEVWILKGMQGEDWVKRHVITSPMVMDLIPFSSMSLGREMIFVDCKDSTFYAYDFESEGMRKVEMEGGIVKYYTPGCLPHVNSLASW